MAAAIAPIGRYRRARWHPRFTSSSSRSSAAGISRVAPRRRIGCGSWPSCAFTEEATDGCIRVRWAQRRWRRFCRISPSSGRSPPSQRRRCRRLYRLSVRGWSPRSRKISAAYSAMHGTLQDRIRRDRPIWIRVSGGRACGSALRANAAAGRAEVVAATRAGPAMRWARPARGEDRLHDEKEEKREPRGLAGMHGDMRRSPCSHHSHERQAEQQSEEVDRGSNPASARKLADHR